MLTEGKLSGEGMRKIECTERVWLLITVNILLLFSQDRSSLSLESFSKIVMQPVVYDVVCSVLI